MRHFFSFFVFLLTPFVATCHPLPQTPPKVSVICPTYDREERLPNLYRAFQSQSYENRELLILDDSPKPSPFFTRLNDPRVKYFHSPLRASIGSKRNQLIELATGEIIAHFDDDDYYAPGYLTEMVNSLGDADLIKLSKWLAWREFDGTLWEWDATFMGPFQFNIPSNSCAIVLVRVDLMQNYTDFIDKNTWGYGFSYVYRKSLWNKCHFDDLSWGEDFSLITKARALGKKMIHIPDSKQLTLHTMHSESSSSIFPQQQFPNSLIARFFGNDIQPWLQTHLKLAVIDQPLLNRLFQSYWATDPYLKSFVAKHNFNDYEICFVESRDAYYIEKSSSDLIKAGFIKKGIFWEKHVDEQFKKFVKPGSTVIDVGAHIGTHALSLSRLVGRQGSVHVFEPQTKLFSELVLNMYLNGCHNVVFHREALGDKQQEIEMDPINTANEGNSLVGAGGDKAKMIRLDDLQFTNLSLIKIDAEGYEEKVIEGALKTIAAHKPVLIIEIWSDAETLNKIKRIEELGYQAFNLSNVHDYLFIPRAI